MQLNEIVLVKHVPPVDDGVLSVFGANKVSSFYTSDKALEVSARWFGMLNRCYNPLDASYLRYGAKGVTVCKRWHSFESFREDLLKMRGYSTDLHLDEDILGSHQYGPTTCVLLSRQDNAMLNGTPVKFSWLGAQGYKEHYFTSLVSASRELDIPETSLLRYFNNPKHLSTKANKGNKKTWVQEVHDFHIEDASVSGYTILPLTLAEQLQLDYAPCSTTLKVFS